jgi:predicted restriction endonuclease
MAGIKRTAADIAFSDAIRESFDYECVECGINRRTDPGRMDCSHVFSRKHRSTRWTVVNALCLCRSCHQKMTDRPLVHAELVKEWLGQRAYDDLMLKHNQPKKIPKWKEKEIAAHYRKQTRDIEELRFAGHKGYIQPEDWEDVESF